MENSDKRSITPVLIISGDEKVTSRFVMTKDVAQKAHFRKRMWCRYRIKVNKWDIRSIKDDIRNHKSYIVEIQSNRIMVLLVFIRGKLIPVVYDTLRNNLVTCLDMSMLNKDQLDMYNHIMEMKKSEIGEKV